MPVTVEERVTNLEQTMNRFALEMLDFKDEMRAFKDEMRAFKEEMLEFKDEMRAFKDEMLEFKDEMRAFKDEMLEFKDEMRAFKDEMRIFKDEVRASQKQMDRRWGELANKMGTMAEDLVAPSVPRILQQVVECPEEGIESMAVRVRRRQPETGTMREFDVVAACGEYVLVSETKSTLRADDMRDFAEMLPDIRRFFPEYSDRKFIGAIGSLYVEPGLVRYGERLGLIVLGFGEEVMSVLNTPDFVPRAF